MLFPISENKASNCFDLVHCDLWEPYRIKSLCGVQYFLTVIDDASTGVWIYLLKDKSEVSQHLKEFCVMIHTQFGANIKVIRSDNGYEFISSSMKKFYSDQGIIHQTSYIDTQ